MSCRKTIKRSLFLKRFSWKIISYIFFSALAFLSTGFAIFSFTHNETQQIITKSNIYNSRFPQEKIYLHLDRPSYWANNDIWFKAYVKDSPINECNLYVELINSSGSVVYKNIAWVQNGLAYGDIHLGDTLSSGIYQIRAYTNWMRNFDDIWFFRQDLLIWNLRDKEFVAESNGPKQKSIDLQFFPEGGTFITGVYNKVAFKAVDNRGKGIDFEGVIIDNSGNRVVDLKSGYKGIGSFVFRPEKGVKYSAVVSFSDNVVKGIDLPKHKNEGVILSINSIDPAIIEIKLTEISLDRDRTKETEYLVLGQSGGEICYQSKLAAKEEINTIEIEKHTLPGGIIKFTLFDPNLVPVCERLVFNNHVSVVNLIIKAEKSVYIPREKVNIGIGACTSNGEACITNLSMSVYNASAQLENKEYPNNIFTQFLLNSELKGTIENPAYYFKDDSLSTLIALDNLMLTHGYREFEWKEILEDAYPEIHFQPEPSIEIKGQVISTGLGRPVVNGKVTMVALKSLLGVYEQVTDSLGQFAFSNLYFYDTIYVAIKALNQRGKNATSIKIDSSSWTSPKSKILPYPIDYYRNESIQTLDSLRETKNYLIKKKWTLSDTIQFDDVYVLAPKKESDDGHPRRYLKADYVFDMQKQDDVLGNVFESIEGRFPGVVYQGDGFYARGDRVKIYMDGMEDKYGVVRSLPSQMFDKVEYVRSGISAGINYKGGILFFYAKRGGQFVSAPGEAFGMESARVIGYSVSRKFYSPVYESTDQDKNIKDNRKTIYWNPVVRTDSTGFAQVAFCHSDETGDMRIVVEGVTSDGKLCRGISTYKVRSEFSTNNHNCPIMYWHYVDIALVFSVIHFYRSVRSTLLVRNSEGERRKLLQMVEGYTLYALRNNVKRVFEFTLINGWYTTLTQKTSDTSSRRIYLK